MTRILIILVVLLLCNSCKTGQEKVVIEELLIFGHSGFCFKDSANQVYPSSEIWDNDSVKLDIDSTRLDIRQYFEFKRDSFIRIAIRRPLKSTEYLSLAQSDTIGFEKLINKILVNKRFKTDYGFTDTLPRFYDGWHYTLYFRTSNKNDFLMNYIPDYLPDSLLMIHDFVEKIIMKNNPSYAKEFEFNSLTTREAKRLFIKYPPPPLPDNLKNNVIYQHR